MDGITDRLPDVALVEVNFPGLGQMEVFGPGVTIVDDEFYCLPSTVLVFSAVVDVFTGDIPQDDWSFEDLFQLSHVVNGCTAFVNSLLPPPYFRRRVGVGPWPLRTPSKCSTTLCATQLRSPSLNGARLAGSVSLMG